MERGGESLIEGGEERRGGWWEARRKTLALVSSRSLEIFLFIPGTAGDAQLCRNATHEARTHGKRARRRSAFP